MTAECICANEQLEVGGYDRSCVPHLRAHLDAVITELAAVRREADAHASRALSHATACAAAETARDMLHARIHNLAKHGCGATSAELWNALKDPT